MDASCKDVHVLAQLPTQMRSCNRESGTLVTKCINVDKNTMGSFLIAKVLPSIKSMLANNYTRLIFTPHAVSMLVQAKLGSKLFVSWH
jgi:hypothetical protein